MNRHLLPILLPALLTAGLMGAGCTDAPFTPYAVSEEGTVAVRFQPTFEPASAERRVQQAGTVVERFMARDVQHLVLSLYRLEHLDDDGVLDETAIGSVDLTNVQAGEGFFVPTELSFKKLRANTFYRVRAVAYSDETLSPGAIISVAGAASETDFRTYLDESPEAVTVPVQLAPKAFRGAGNALGIDVVRGGYVPYGYVKRVAGIPNTSGTPVPDPSPESADTAPTSDYLHNPTGIVANGDTAWIADTDNHCLRVLKRNASGVYDTLRWVAGSTVAEEGFNAGPVLAAAARFSKPRGMALGPNGTIFIADTNNNCIRVFDPINQGGTVSVLAGGGPAAPGHDNGSLSSATFNQPEGLVYDSRSNVLFVADTGNHMIRAIDLVNNQVTTLAGQLTAHGGNDQTNPEFVGFDHPSGLLVRKNTVLVADRGNHAIRTVKFSRQETGITFGGSATLAGGQQNTNDGPGATAGFNNPTALAFNRMGEIYVVDRGYHRIRLLTPQSDGTVVVSTLTGQNPGSSDGAKNAAHFLYPEGLTFDPETGRLLVADTGNHLIRQVD